MPHATSRRAVFAPVWLLKFWLLGLWLLAPVASAAPALAVDAEFRSTSLASHIDLLEDESGDLTIADVTSPRWVHAFRPAQPTELEQRPRPAVLWLRFALNNIEPSQQLLILRMLPAGQHGAGVYDASGRALPGIHQADEIPLFQLVLPPGERAIYYVRLMPDIPLRAQLHLYSLDSYLTAQRNQSWADHVGIGALLALTLAALLSAIVARDPLYLWLVAYGLLNLIAHSANWPQILPHYDRLHVLLAAQMLAIACIVGLARRFPAYPEDIRAWRYTLDVLIVLDVLGAALIFVLPTASLHAFATTLQMTSIVLTIASALHAYLITHRRMMLAYAAVRFWIVAAGTAIAFAKGGFAPDHESLSLLLLVENIELVGLLTLVSIRTLKQIAYQTREQRAIAAAEAEGRARTEIVAEVGHRIRTPVSGVLGMLEMLQDTPLSATQRDYLGTIQRAGNELLNVVNDLSDISKLEAYPGALQHTAFDPQTLVAECIDGFRGLAGTHRLELISDPSPDLPAYVSGDPTRLRQILLQLLHHSVAHCERGEVVVQIGNLPQQWLQFHINTDAESPQGAVSAMDRRVTALGAAGLRLGVARQLVDTLGGRIQVRQQAPGKLAITFELPLPAAAPSAGITAAQEPALRNKQLLVVDDSPTFCEVLRRQAGHWGMAVHTAINASEALARLRNQITLGQPIDALLVDADMPELADVEWLQRVRAEISQQPIVILLASRPEVASSENLRHLGVRRVLLKPVNHTSLKITLAEELSYPGQAAARDPQRQRQPIRCLVAEDNVINTKVLLGMLQKLGVECTAVVNGQEAVEACQRQDYDIVLMDCDMPIMDGWEATRRIREIQTNRGRRPMPIIALTANTLAELGERARQPLMDAHLVKPIHLLELQALLERWTGKVIHADMPA